MLILLACVLLLAQDSGPQAPLAPSGPNHDRERGDARSRSLLDLFFPRIGEPQGQPRPLATPDLAREVTLVVALSSTSAACEAAAPLLAELQGFHERGLGIVGLAFDGTGDFERDAALVAGFAKDHHLEFPFFLAGKADPEWATQALGLREAIGSFPAFFFLGREGGLRGSLEGKATPQGPLLRAELERRIEQLLSEPREDGAELWQHLRSTEWKIRPSRGRMFPGERVDFLEAEGSRIMRVSGWSDDLPVVLRGTRLDGSGAWRFDSDAGVLLDPLKFGTRMHPAGGSATPLLEKRGFTGADGLARALSDAEALVRREALFALGDQRRRKGDASEALPLLDDADLEVRIAAAWALGEARDERAREPLRKLENHPHPALRCEALSALAKLRGREDFVRFAKIIETDIDPLAKWALLSEMLD
jgi:HEAT repeat protein